MNDNTAYAITSTCTYKSHILLWDFDINDFYLIVLELKRIQKKYELPDIYIIKSTRGYNAICLAKLIISQAYKIKRDTKFTDKIHNKMGFVFNKWCLRISRDKSLACVIKSCNKGNYKLSLSHKIFLENWLNMICENGNYDDNTDIEMESYPDDRHIKEYNIL